MRVYRRDFLKFMGATSAFQILGKTLLSAKDKNEIEGLKASNKDQLEFIKGLSAQILIRSGDKITKQGALFGSSPDFIALIPGSNPDDISLWVNHETPEVLSLHAEFNGAKKTKSQVDLERQSVGGSFIRVKRDSLNKWSVQKNDPSNFRIDGSTKIPFAARLEVLGAKVAEGTLSNCSGGQTPWGNILTCEENPQTMYGDAETDKKFRVGNSKADGGAAGWSRFYPNPPEHYGWVVEVDPRRKSAKKLLSLGRFSHEGALVVLTQSNRCVVYMGDDAPDQCIYKFIADHAGNLETGTLYAADLEKGRWLSLSMKDNPRFKAKYKNEVELLIRTREAAEDVGASKVSRPEGIARNPITGEFLISLTGDPEKGNPFGSILKLIEKNNDPLSLNFTASEFISGGLENHFAMPDNLAFDQAGNLWMSCDISGSKQNAGVYENFGNNSLFVFPRKGPQAGRAIRVANAPLGAEFTGPCFSPNGETLFLSVQHPGEAAKSVNELKGTWPDGGMPRSAVIAIHGPLLNQLRSA